MVCNVLFCRFITKENFRERDVGPVHYVTGKRCSSAAGYHGDKGPDNSAAIKYYKLENVCEFLLLFSLSLSLSFGISLCNFIGMCIRSGRRVAHKNNCSLILVSELCLFD